MHQDIAELAMLIGRILAEKWLDEVARWRRESHVILSDQLAPDLLQPEQSKVRVESDD